jgi:hypothetical protein
MLEDNAAVHECGHQSSRRGYRQDNNTTALFDPFDPTCCPSYGRRRYGTAVLVGAISCRNVLWNGWSDEARPTVEFLQKEISRTTAARLILLTKAMGWVEVVTVVAAAAAAASSIIHDGRDDAASSRDGSVVMGGSGEFVPEKTKMSCFCLTTGAFLFSLLVAVGLPPFATLEECAGRQEQ